MSPSSSPSPPTDETTMVSVPKLQTLNYVNVAAYLLNFLVVFGYTYTGLPDNAQLSNKYQTLVTPAPYAFSIWGIIFTAELIWTIVQCFPSFRSHKVVVKSVGYNFALACVAQSAWTFAFGLEHMVLSLICMMCILIPLVNILIKTCEVSNTTKTIDYWRLKFPFQIHAAWIMAATAVNLNVVAVAYNASSKIQTAVGWISLVVLFGVGIYTVMKKENYRRAYVVPSVLVWASFAIANELSSPRDQILETFDGSTIEYTQTASKLVALLVLLVTLEEFGRSWLYEKESESEAAQTETTTEGEYRTLN